MAHAIRRAGLVAVGLASLAGVASSHGQVLAYEGFGYAAGSPLLGQGGGFGFSSLWQSAGYGSWLTGSTDSTYVSGSLQLQTSGLRAQSGLGGFQRTLQLSQPLGNSPGSVWVSFVARQTSGPGGSSWLGVKLPCVGSANPFLFLGKPFGMAHWGADAGLSGSVVQTGAPASTQAFIVARIDFNAGADDVHVWINPGLASTPADASADLSLPAYGDFAGITKLLVETGTSAGAITGVLDEVRLGGAFAEVAPVKPGLVVNGFEHAAAGEAIFEPTPDGRGVHVSNLGSSGQDGVEIKWKRARGASIDIHPADLAAGGEIKIKHKGWDGLIYHRVAASMMSDGRLSMDCDLMPMHVSSVRVVGTDSGGTVVQDETTPGGLASFVVNGNVTISGPCPDGSFPQWNYTTVLYNPPKYVNGQWIEVEQTWIFGCPGPRVIMGRNMLKVYGIVDAGVVNDVGLASTTVSGTGLSSFDVSEASVQFDGASVSGHGSMLLAETCDDGSDCDSWEGRKLVASNIGSSGQDGVEINWRTSPPSTQGTFTLGDVLSGHGSAHVAMGGSAGSPPCTLDVTQTPDGLVLITPDYTGVGASGTMVTGYDTLGQITGEVLLGPGEGLPLDQVICGPGSYPIWGWYTMWVWNPWPTYGSYQTQWGVVGCGGMGGGGFNWPDSTARFAFTPVNPTVGVDPSSLTMTGSDLSAMEVLSLSTDEVHPCTVDFNNDGFLDFFDYDDYVNCFETGTCPAGRSADFNGDGFADFFDYDDFVGAFEHGC